MRLLALAAAVALAGCVAAPEEPPSPPGMTAVDVVFAIVSPAFADGDDIPREHSCDGGGASPPLTVAGAPEGAATLALIVEDPDVPTPLAPQRTITHWLLWNAPLAEGGVELPSGALPPGAVEGEDGWRPPCPPPGSPAHRYVFHAYAVGGAFDLAAGASRAELEAALEGNVLADATLTGMYARAVLPR